MFVRASGCAADPDESIERHSKQQIVPTLPVSRNTSDMMICGTCDDAAPPPLLGIHVQGPPSVLVIMSSEGVSGLRVAITV